MSIRLRLCVSLFLSLRISVSLVSLSLRLSVSLPLSLSLSLCFCLSIFLSLLSVSFSESFGKLSSILDESSDSSGREKVLLDLNLDPIVTKPSPIRALPGLAQVGRSSISELRELRNSIDQSLQQPIQQNLKGVTVLMTMTLSSEGFCSWFFEDCCQEKSLQEARER